MSQTNTIRRRIRLIVAGIFIGLAGVLFFFTDMVIPTKVASGESHWLDTQLAALHQKDPSLAKKLEEARQIYGDWSTAVAWRAAEIGDKGNSHDSMLGKLALDLKEGKKPASIELAQLQRKCGGDSEGFFTAHGTSMQITNDDKQHYLADLDRAIENPRIRSIIHDDPVAISVWKQAPTYLEYYANNLEWLSEILVQLESEGSQTDLNSTNSKNPVQQVLEVSQKYHPLPKQAVESGLGAVGVGLFIPFGELIQELVRAQIPVQEAVEVIFSNQIAVEQYNPTRRAAWLVEVHKKYPTLWRMALDHPGILEFMEATKDDQGYELAKSVLEQYGPRLPIQLLGQSCPDAIKPGARALKEYGERAITILTMYAKDPRLEQYLNDESVSIRVIPYLAQFTDEGFDTLKQNIAYLDKYLEKDGRPKVAEWWTHIPTVGGPVNVIRNWATGIPNEWSELGWAALDVGDGALVILSFGSSAALTTTAKQGAKRGSIELSRSAAKQAGRLTRKAEQAGVEAAIKSGGRYAESSLLKRALSFTGKATSIGWKTIKVGGLVISETKTLAINSAKTIHTTWKSVPQKVRRWVYRAALGATLYISIQERVLPNRDKIATGAVELTKQIADQTSKTTGMLLAEAAQLLAALLGPITQLIWQNVLRYIVPILLVLFAIRIAFRRRQVQYV